MTHFIASLRPPRLLAALFNLSAVQPKPPVRFSPGEYLPAVEELAAVRTDRERAEWLLTVPLGLIYKHHNQVREVLENCQFTTGLNFVTLTVAFFSMRRDLNGNAAAGMQKAFEAQIADLRAVLREDAVPVTIGWDLAASSDVSVEWEADASGRPIAIREISAHATDAIAYLPKATETQK